jgi:hypothetical protein
MHQATEFRMAQRLNIRRGRSGRVRAAIEHVEPRRLLAAVTSAAFEYDFPYESPPKSQRVSVSFDSDVASDLGADNFQFENLTTNSFVDSASVGLATPTASTATLGFGTLVNRSLPNGNYEIRVW